MSKRIVTLRQLRDALPGINVEDDAYDIGYWLCYAKQPRPTEKWTGKDLSLMQEGWDQAKADEDERELTP
jgi:hypothetical protein